MFGTSRILKLASINHVAIKVMVEMCNITCHACNTQACVLQACVTGYTCNHLC